MLEKNVTLSLKGCVRGALMCVPVFPGIIVFGAVFGTVAAQKGLTFLETLLMNSLVYAGASQFVAMEIFKEPLDQGTLLAMIGVTAAVNMRMLLIGASLRPWLGQLPGQQTYPALFFLTDINWLLTLAQYDKGERDWGIYLGSGLTVWSVWSLSVIPGYFAGSLISDPKTFGLDLVLPAFFAALLVPLWKGRRQTWSWAIAGGVAWVTWTVFGGYWGIFTGAFAGQSRGLISMTEGAFTADTMVLVAILGMAMVTYALRAGGYWIMGRVHVTPRIRRGLEALPGAIIVSTILPIILQGGLVVGLCIIVAVAAQLRMKKEYIAVFCAATAAAALRAGGM